VYRHRQCVSPVSLAGGRIKRAFEACGYELQVQLPDREWLAWYSEHKRARDDITLLLARAAL
jgi:hypothetical protein